jgi:hypothetical protein
MKFVLLVFLFGLAACTPRAPGEPQYVSEPDQYGVVCYGTGGRAISCVKVK